jgi:predicted glycogen debranching enzyme
VLVSIYENLSGRNPYGIRLDSTSGMLGSPAGFTWMNTNNPQATPRAGYPVEIQALWYQVLEILARIYPPHADQAHRQRAKLREKFMELFWSDQYGYLADVLLADEPAAADKAQADPALRFNQLSAIHAGLVGQEHSLQILEVIAAELLIPAGVRSLAEAPLWVPLTITDRQGNILADPRMPYRGQCVGDETARRLAYHNGSAWCWAYPGFIEARASVFGYSELSVKQALAYFEPIWTELASGGIGTLAELKDGNYPHHPRGCYASALSVAETLRVYMKLKYAYPPSG